MPRPCSCCTHPDALAIDRALLGGGETLRNIAARFGVSTDSLRRHKRSGHLVEAVTRDSIAATAATDGGDQPRPGELLRRVRDLEQRALTILNAAERNGSLGVALNAVREVRSTIELLAKLVGDLNAGGVSIVIESPGWVEVRQTIITALEHHPEAGAAVAAALRSIEARSSE